MFIPNRWTIWGLAMMYHKMGTLCKGERCLAIQAMATSAVHMLNGGHKALSWEMLKPLAEFSLVSVGEAGYTAALLAEIMSDAQMSPDIFRQIRQLTNSETVEMVKQELALLQVHTMKTGEVFPTGTLISDDSQIITMKGGLA